ncbi:uncharacterized protein LOC133184990 [Saccostrea echinata]|uniref:uncharacterized protein LOC133184990 n=1 Tax=Saccostrea echinata TaxID=191078 RepID=UPI002A8374B1|nr:uncharacterized protein LOC133184990 [Saccostrea echinata]
MKLDGNSKDVSLITDAEFTEAIGRDTESYLLKILSDDKHDKHTEEFMSVGLSGTNKLLLQMSILVFDYSLIHADIDKLSLLEKVKHRNLNPDELMYFLEKSMAEKCSDKCMVAFLNMMTVTINLKEVLEIVKFYSEFSNLSIKKRTLNAFIKTDQSMDLVKCDKKVTFMQFNVKEDYENFQSSILDIFDDVKNVVSKNSTESKNFTEKEKRQKFDYMCKARKTVTKESKSHDIKAGKVNAKTGDSKSDKKAIKKEKYSEAISIRKSKIDLSKEANWPMKSIHKVPRSAVPPLHRPPLFSILESKSSIRDELGIQFTNDEVMLPFLTVALNEVIHKKHHLRVKLLANSKPLPRHVTMPEDIVTFEPLSMFRYFGISTTIMAYPFIHEVNGIMENHFNRLASFKDWPLSAPVSALRLVDSGFYFDVQKSSVACYACKLHIETTEISSVLGGDTVLNMHLRLSENCSHALQQKRDKEGVGSYALPFLKSKSEMNTGIFSSNFHSAIQQENTNPLPELKDLGISEKNSSNTGNIFHPYNEGSSENINVQQENKISNITRDFFINKNEETYLKYDSGYNSQKNPSYLTENVSDSKGLPIQTESTDSLSYMTMLGEPNLQPHSLFGEEISSATAGLEEMESSPSPGISIHEPSKIKNSSSTASFFDATAAEEEQSYSIRHPDYKTVESRLKTFVFWPFNDKQSKVILVQCGFFFTGQQDIVRCFACDIGLAEWDETDDPWSEHARHSPHCKYLKKMKGQDFINRVQQEWRKIYNPKTPQMQDFNRRLESFKTDQWPSSITQTPKQIAEAGFYFTGEEDAVRCHYCDGGLREWEPGDDPWTEHARWFPFCKFVMKIKGIQFIDEIQQKYEMGAGNLDSLPQSGSNTTGPGKPSEEDNNPLYSPAAKSLISMGYSRVKVQHVIDKFVAEKGHNEFTTSNLLEILLEMEDKGETFPPEPKVQTQSKPSSQGPGSFVPFTETSESEQELDPEIIEEENQRLKKQLLCVKCEKSERVIVFTPCGHRLVCKPCSEPMKRCIKCKKKIQKKVKTFLC